MSRARAPFVLSLLLACAHAPPAHAPPAPEVERVPHRAHSGAVGIEYWVRSPAQETAAPVLLVPGMTGWADTWRSYPALLDGLVAAGHRVVSVSLRGRGGSDSPETGWSFEDHVGDLEAVVHAEGLTRFHVVAHSMGVAYALGLALRAPERVLTMTAGDYLPLVIRVNEGWVSGVGGDVDNRKKYDRRLARRVFEEQGPALDAFGAQDQLVRDLRPELPRLTAALLVVLGTHDQPDARVALHAEAWAGAPRLRVERVDTGHDVFARPEVVATTLAWVAQ